MLATSLELTSYGGHLQFWPQDGVGVFFLVDFKGFNFKKNGIDGPKGPLDFINFARADGDMGRVGGASTLPELTLFTQGRGKG